MMPEERFLQKKERYFRLSEFCSALHRTHLFRANSHDFYPPTWMGDRVTKKQSKVFTTVFANDGLLTSVEPGTLKKYWDDLSSFLFGVPVSLSLPP